MNVTRPRILKPPTSSFFLLGPRGTGKTVWTQQTYPEALRIDLLHPATGRQYMARPEQLVERVRTLDPRTVVVIDEIQKQPTLLEVVHYLMNEGVKNQFILTSSSARKLHRADSLRSLAAHPKFYFADVSLYRANRP